MALAACYFWLLLYWLWWLQQAARCSHLTPLPPPPGGGLLTHPPLGGQTGYLHDFTRKDTGWTASGGPAPAADLLAVTLTGSPDWAACKELAAKVRPAQTRPPTRPPSHLLLCRKSFLVREEQMTCYVKP